MQHSYDPPGGALHARGRQLTPEEQAPFRRSRSVDGSRPQYKDARRNFTSPTRTKTVEMAAPTAFGVHLMAPSEPTYHDVEGSCRQQSRQQQKQSRSLSPAGPRRGTIEAIPYDPYNRVRQNVDPYQQFVEQAYNQRYARQERVHRKEMTESLLMFSDAFDTASALTGWSEQELIQKKKKKYEKKEKGYFKKKKHREPRILNMPGALKRNNSSSELSTIGELKRYYRGGDGPNGTMTRGVTQKRTISKPKSDSPKRHWNIVPTFSKSSEMDSTQSSTDVPEDVSNPAVRRWIKSKQRRKKKEDFPLLSSKSSEKASFPKKDAPGPVARRPSPQIFESAPYQHDVGGEQLHIASEGRQSRSPTPRSPSSKSPSRRSVSSSSPSIRSNSSRSPSRQPNIALSRVVQQESNNTYSDSDDPWMQPGADLNVTPDNDTSYRFLQSGGTAMNHTADLPDDRSPTSVTSRQVFKKGASKQKSLDGSSKPRSILRNSPRQSQTRHDGTYPLNRTRSSYDEDDNSLPQRMRTRFSDNVEQRTYYMDEDKYISESGKEPSFMNNNSDQGAFPVQEQSPGSLDNFDSDHGDLFSRPNQDRAQAVKPTYFGKEEEGKSEESMQLGAVPRCHADATEADINPTVSTGSDDSTNISKDPPNIEGIGFTDLDGKALSPIRPTKNSNSKLDPVDRGSQIRPIPKPQLQYARQPVPAVHAISPVRSIPRAYNIESPPRDYSDTYETSVVPTCTYLDGGEQWINDEAYDIADDEFQDHESDLAFMQVVAAVVIQTTFRRYLAVLTFERMVEAHFKSIAGPDIMDPLVTATQRRMPTLQAPQMQQQHIEEAQLARRQPTISTFRAPPIIPARPLIQKSAPSEAKPFRPDPPPQNQRERVQLYIKCAINIQRTFRGWWVRDSLHVDHYCATLIQQAVRGFLSRNYYYYDMYRIILAQAQLRMLIAQEMAAERFACIVIIQAHIRGYLVRMNTCRNTSDDKLQLAQYAAATKIQALLRAFTFQEKYLNILADILIVQSVARRWITVMFDIPHVTSGHIADTAHVLDVDLNNPDVDSNHRQKVVEPRTEELPSRRMGEMSHNEALGMWRKKKMHTPNSPVRPSIGPNSAMNHHVEKVTQALHPITTTPSEDVSVVEKRRTATAPKFRAVVISPADEASAPQPAKRHPVVISPNTGEALYGAESQIKDEPKRDVANYSNSGKRGGVASRYAPSTRGAAYGKQQAQVSAKSRNIRRYPVAPLDGPSTINSTSWEEESQKRQGAASYGTGLKASVDQLGQGVVASPKLCMSRVVTAREALMNSQSFDSPSRTALSPAPKNPVVAAREAIMNPLSFDSSTKVPTSPQHTPPQLSTPKRKPPKNSAAAFWEQKTANQPKPMFPPKGGLYYSSG